MRSKTVLKIERVGPHTRVTAIGYDPSGRYPIGDIGVDFDQAAVRRVITDLCRCAGLPEPWKG